MLLDSACVSTMLSYSILTHNTLTEVAFLACSQAARKQRCLWLRRLVYSSESYKAVMFFTDSSHWQDNAVLGVCQHRQIPPELSVFGLGQITKLEQSQDLRRQTVRWVRLFPSGVAVLGPLQQLLSSLTPGVLVSHISFHRSLALLSLMLKNSVFPPGGNEGNSFVLGF